MINSSVETHLLGIFKHPFVLMVTMKTFERVSGFLSREQILVHPALPRSSSSAPAQTAKQRMHLF